MVVRTLLGILLLGFIAAGCSVADTDTGISSINSRGIEASSLSERSVRIRWKSAAEPGAAYGLHWESMDHGSDSGLFVQTDTTAIVDGLRPGELYIFTETDYRDGNPSSPIAGSRKSMVWATARHYVTEASTNAIRIYETGSNVGSALVLDTALGGPRNLDLRISSDTNRGQLALFTVPGDSTTFKIGPAYAFSSYRTQYAVDSTIFISRTTEPVSGLNAWYSSDPIDELIDPNGNTKAYMLPALQPDSLGQGFYVRTGSAGNYHYARVFIVNLSGVLLQGHAPNRFVELEISYQPAPNLPYAKTIDCGEKPAGVRARRER